MNENGIPPSEAPQAEAPQEILSLTEAANKMLAKPDYSASWLRALVPLSIGVAAEVGLFVTSAGHPSPGLVIGTAFGTMVGEIIAFMNV